ncbi:MAG TPA: helix-turn-helix transcriptional regulator [Lachnospiraceae bacterium]
MSEKEFNQIFSHNLNRYLQEHKMTQLDLAERLSVSPASVSHWCNGAKSPRMDKIDKMCSIFGILRSDLMEDHTNDEDYYTNAETAKIAQEIFESSDLRVLFDASKDATPEQMKKAAEYLTFLKSTNNEG